MKWANIKDRVIKHIQKEKHLLIQVVTPQLFLCALTAGGQQHQGKFIILPQQHSLDIKAVDPDADERVNTVSEKKTDTEIQRKGKGSVSVWSGLMIYAAGGCFHPLL